MTDKNIEKETFCKAGITTAMIEDQRVGKFTSGLATIMEGNRVSRDLRESRQWCDRCEYRERQFHTSNTPQGIPVAKKLENAGKIHVNYKGPLLNFASCQLTELATHFTKGRWQLIWEVLEYMKIKGRTEAAEDEGLKVEAKKNVKVTAEVQRTVDDKRNGQVSQEGSNHIFRQSSREIDQVRETAKTVTVEWILDPESTEEMRPEEWRQSWSLITVLLIELHEQAPKEYKWNWKMADRNLRIGVESTSYE
jgi:hypothetical protein